MHILGSRGFGGAAQFYVRLVRALHEAGEPVTAVTRADCAVVGTLRENGIDPLHVPLRGRWDLGSVRRIRRLVAARGPCVVQTYLGKATRLTRLPASSESVHVARLGGFYKLDGYYRHAHAWVGNTRGICDYLVRSGLPAERVFHIGNFVPDPRALTADERAELRREARVPPGAWVVAGLGRLIAKKGFPDLLEALALLPAELAGRQVVTLIVGDGEDRPALEAQTGTLGIAGRVRFLGWREDPDPWLDLSDLVVVPSRHEPLGNVILEAWSHRRAVVSTASDGALELMRDGENGLVVPCADPHALAEAIRAVLAGPEQARVGLGEGGYTELRETHGREAVLDAYRELYARLLRERAGRG